MAGMAERQKEWQNGRMAEVATYVLFMVHANNDDDNDTLIFYITDTEEFDTIFGTHDKRFYFGDKISLLNKNNGVKQPVKPIV